MFVVDLFNRPHFNKVLPKDLSSDLRGAAVSEQFASGDKRGIPQKPGTTLRFGEPARR